MTRAFVAALVLGTVVVAAALVLTAEDQRVYDLTACMRTRGWQVAYPNTENGTGHVVPGFSSVVSGGDQQAFNADLDSLRRGPGVWKSYGDSGRGDQPADQQP